MGIQNNGVFAVKLDGRPHSRLSQHGYYWNVCYENGLRMYKKRKRKEHLARRYADRCVKPNISFDYKKVCKY